LPLEFLAVNLILSPVFTSLGSPSPLLSLADREILLPVPIRVAPSFLYHLVVSSAALPSTAAQPGGFRRSLPDPPDGGDASCRGFFRHFGKKIVSGYVYRAYHPAKYGFKIFGFCDKYFRRYYKTPAVFQRIHFSDFRSSVRVINGNGKLARFVFNNPKRN
jgi:hypothetical protein